MASSLDILPTILGLLGSPSPVSHGVDLLEEEREHFGFYSQRSASAESGLGPFAIRYKQYKAHFFTEGNSLSDDTNYDAACHQSSRRNHTSQPLMFDLNSDPGERHSIDPDTAEYKAALKAVLRVRDHLDKTVTWAPSEVLKGTSRDAEPCCNTFQGTACEPFPKCCNCNQAIPSVTLL